MIITPSLPSPQQPSAQVRKQAVEPVRAPGVLRDAADEPSSRRQAPASDQGTPRTNVSMRQEVLAAAPGPLPMRAHRALAAYARVAADSQQRSLRDMLGFDAFA